MISILEKSKHFFGGLLPERCFTKEAYEKRREAPETVNEIDKELDEILRRYESRQSLSCDCQWR